MTTHPGKAYQFRVFVRKVSPAIWRRIVLRDDQTVADLHDTLQVVFGWTDEFLHRFHIRSRTYAVPRLNGAEYTHSASETTLSALHLKPRERFIYEYNFFVWWQVEIRFEKAVERELERTYPFCVAGSRAGPLEDGNGPHDYLHLLSLTYHPALLLFRIRDIAVEYEGDEGGFRAELRHQFPELDYWLIAHQFDPHTVNQQLHTIFENRRQTDGDSSSDYGEASG